MKALAASIVSDHGAATGRPSPIEMVAAVADAVAGKGAVLVDGAFRRGSDIAKALALGAQAVLIARPVMWGLAAYGADGVQAVRRNAAKRSRPEHGRARRAELEGAHAQHGPDRPPIGVNMRANTNHRDTESQRRPQAERNAKMDRFDGRRDAARRDRNDPRK